MYLSMIYKHVVAAISIVYGFTHTAIVSHTILVYGLSKKSLNEERILLFAIAV